jgi:carboxymethylenebutenolidase
VGEAIEIVAGDRRFTAYLATAETGSGPGVLVLHSWWGLTDHFKRVCDRFAAEGFTAIAPDLYHGPQTNDPDEAERLLDALDADQAKADIFAALDVLKAQPATRDGGLGVVGFSMGGAQAMATAPLRPDVLAVVLFYGLELTDFAPLRAAVQGHFVPNDYPSGQDERELERRLRAAGKTVDIYVYPGAEHAFFNPTRPEAYDEAAARLAWTRTLDFLHRHLGPA